MPRFDQLPDKDASSDEKREAQAQRAKKWGIKAQEDARLTPPADFPQDEEDYADPVNLAFLLKDFVMLLSGFHNSLLLAILMTQKEERLLLIAL